MDKKITAAKIAAYGIFLSMIIVLSIAESLLTPPNFLNIRLGLSNIVIMYSLFHMGRKDAFFLAVLKALFAFTTRGATAGLMSFSGGMFSILIMILLNTFFKERISILLLSVSGGICHNIGQMIMAVLILSNRYLFYYLPAFIATGAACGILTGALLKTTLPYLSRVNKSGGR